MCKGFSFSFKATINTIEMWELLRWKIHVNFNYNMVCLLHVAIGSRQLPLDITDGAVGALPKY